MRPETRTYERLIHSVERAISGEGISVPSLVDARLRAHLCSLRAFKGSAGTFVGYWLSIFDGPSGVVLSKFWDKVFSC